MQLSTAQSVKKRWPGAEVIISSPFKSKAERLYTEYTVIQSTRRNLIVGTLNVVRAFLYQRLYLRLPFLIQGEELTAFSKADIIVDLSGDTLTEDYGPHVTYSHFLPIILGVALKKPVFICAQSIGPFKLTTKFAKYFLNKAYKVTARESITFNYLKELGVDQTKLELLSDMAFLLEPISDQKAKAILKKEKVAPTKPLLGVSLSALVEDRYNKHHETKFADDIAATISNVAETLDLDILFVSHVTGPSDDKNDRLVSKRVAKLVKTKNKVFVLKGDYNPDELKGMIRKCSMMFGARMHANIGALSTGVPVVAIRYSHKTDGIMESFNLKSRVIDIDDMDVKKAEKILLETYKNREKIASGLKTAVEKIKKTSYKNLKIVEQAINS